MIRYRWLLLGALVLVLLTWWALSAGRVGPLEACLSTCAEETAPTGSQLRFMDFNMLHGFPRFQRLAERVDLLSAEIRRLDPDIVCLQEVPWTRQTGSVARRLALQSRMNYAYLPANGNRKAIFFSEGEAILSKFPIQQVSFDELFPRPGLFEHRVALHAAITLPGLEGAGQPVHVFCTHLTNGESRINQGQAGTLERFVSTYPDGLAIIAGDFNAEEDSPQVVHLSRLWVDAFRATHPAEAGLTCCLDPISDQAVQGLEERIDYVFLRPEEAQDMGVVDSQVIFQQPLGSPEDGSPGLLWASDHAGLLVEIEYP